MESSFSQAKTKLYNKNDLNDFHKTLLLAWENHQACENDLAKSLIQENSFHMVKTDYYQKWWYKLKIAPTIFMKWALFKYENTIYLVVDFKKRFLRFEQISKSIFSDRILSDNLKLYVKSSFVIFLPFKFNSNFLFLHAST